MNALNSKTDESNRFMYQFTDKLNLTNPNNNMALANLSVYYTWKNIKSEYNNNKLKLLQLGICLMFLIYKIILNTSSKNMKLLQTIQLFEFMSIK